MGQHSGWCCTVAVGQLLDERRMRPRAWPVSRFVSRGLRWFWQAFLVGFLAAGRPTVGEGARLRGTVRSGRQMVWYEAALDGGCYLSSR